MQAKTIFAAIALTFFSVQAQNVSNTTATSSAIVSIPESSEVSTVGVPAVTSGNATTISTSPQVTATIPSGNGSTNGTFTTKVSTGGAVARTMGAGVFGAAIAAGLALVL
ncbi:hypothetical protein KAFR_0D00255 [Kazachstania africana CBS 2517]|uniref:Protein TOS6 n=1 Tax=Kazachstania africana (strain ATCC 22294 / BCRC 22015 / CBS 2517 / CECT 1963 / NBRC 1671 / NRRL Y-8276) TaxID=1071382 RepID=H2ATH2_KAZAF|nr:hypothetical protein KAFR_0D00255 [Kazachstania africana CBS 2517]CCF57672.1 hypothetical protein KAFR_0D00255 [Kazachstania africana CBS 2517]